MNRQRGYAGIEVFLFLLNFFIGTSVVSAGLFAEVKPVSTQEWNETVREWKP